MKTFFAHHPEYYCLYDEKRTEEKNTKFKILVAKKISDIATFLKI
jgi:hypothetical protein